MFVASKKEINLELDLSPPGPGYPKTLESNLRAAPCDHHTAHKSNLKLITLSCWERNYSEIITRSKQQSEFSCENSLASAEHCQSF